MWCCAWRNDQWNDQAAPAHVYRWPRWALSTCWVPRPRSGRALARWWRRSVGPAAVSRGFPPGAQPVTVGRCRSVSSALPSNRACGSPAHGSPTSFTAGIRLLPPGPVRPWRNDGPVEADQAHELWGGVHHHPPAVPARSLVPLGHKQRQPSDRIAPDLVELAGGVPVAEVAHPAAQEPIDLLHDLLDRPPQPLPRRERTDTIAGVLHRPA